VRGPDCQNSNDQSDDGEVERKGEPERGHHISENSRHIVGRVSYGIVPGAVKAGRAQETEARNATEQPGTTTTSHTVLTTRGHGHCLSVAYGTATPLTTVKPSGRHGRRKSASRRYGWQPWW